MLLARRPNLTAWCKFYTYQRMFVFVFCYISLNLFSDKFFASLYILEHEYCFFKQLLLFNRCSTSLSSHMLVVTAL